MLCTFIVTDNFSNRRNWFNPVYSAKNEFQMAKKIDEERLKITKWMDPHIYSDKCKLM